MWEELEIAIKLNDKCNVDKNRTNVFMGQGNKTNPNIMVVFDHITDEMLESKSIIATEEYEILKNIFSYVGIEISDCYFTSLTKYYNQDIVKDEERKACMSFLLEEIFITNPKNIICVGEDLFNYMYKYYAKDKNNDKLIINIQKNIGKIFDFYGIALIPIFEMKKIKNLSSNMKKLIVKSLKERNK